MRGGQDVMGDGAVEMEEVEVEEREGGPLLATRYLSKIVGFTVTSLGEITISD